MSLLWAAACAWWAAPVLGAAAPRGTAGASLARVVAAARERYPDAELVRITGRTDENASAVCDPESPGTDGWHFHFYSAEKDAFVLIAECEGALLGPMTELLSASPADRAPITGRFFDTDEALKALAQAGAPIDAARRQAGGRRPFSFTLLRVSDPRFAKEPVFWEVRVGRSGYFVNASTHKVERSVIVRTAPEEKKP